MEIDCVLLTWHGTVVCAGAGQDGLFSAPLAASVVRDLACHLQVTVDQGALDLAEDLLAQPTLAYESELLGTGIAHRSRDGRGFHFSRDGRFLCASGEERWVDWNREHAQTWETFLPVPVTQIDQYPENAVWLRNAESEPWEEPVAERLPRELRGAETLYRLPLFAHRDDRRFFLERAVHGRPRLGFSTSQLRIRRAQNVRMLLGRSVEGTLFLERGAIRHYGFLTASTALPRGLSRIGDRIHLERSLIDAAPHLRGDFLVFYNGNLQNYFHWLIEAVITLYLLHQAYGDGARIVLPSALTEVASVPYLESLDLFGLGAIERVICPEPVVRLERAVWLDAPGDLLENIPERDLVALQAAVAASLGVTDATQRVYVEREHLRKVKNAAEVRRFFEDRGFITVRLEGMSMVDQARLFARAAFVAGPHGAGLSNLIFTPPQARVIEFIPNTEMRAFFWHISSKLDHEYAMLPCPTNNGGFNGDMQVDIAKLERLFAFLEHA